MTGHIVEGGCTNPRIPITRAAAAAVLPSTTRLAAIGFCFLFVGVVVKLVVPNDILGLSLIGVASAFALGGLWVANSRRDVGLSVTLAGISLVMLGMGVATLMTAGPSPAAGLR